MWKDYSTSYIKNNRASSISIMTAALVSALCLSFLCSLFYNFWVSDINNIIQDEGDWQGRITGELSDEDMAVIRNFGNVKSVVVNEELSDDKGTVADITFHNRRTVFQDMPLIMAELGLSEDAAEYHLTLLSKYFVHDPQDEEPPLLMAFYLAVLIVVSVSLILIIHNSFALSMNARIHQFGIFSSIGATPRQIWICLMQEALVLSAVPILLGTCIGIALSYAAMQAVSRIAVSVPGGYASDWVYHPAVFIITVLSSTLTVLFSAWVPAGKLSRLTPLEAIRNTGGLQLKKKKHSRILSFLFGIEGELSGNALKAQKKAQRTSTLSLTLSFLSFTLILCFFTLSGISTEYTYFDRYQDAWDVMVTVKDTGIGDFDLTPNLQEMDGVRDCTVYQKAKAQAFIPAEWQSAELTRLGGLDVLSGSFETPEGYYEAVAPVIVLDDESFMKYCEAVNIEPQLDGSILLNRIWDSVNSNFRYKEYIPFVVENKEAIYLKSSGQKETTALPVLAYTQEAPVLREEYENFALVQFVPVSMWEKVSGQIGGAEDDTYIRVLGEEGITLAGAEELEDRIAKLIGRNYDIEIENRIGEKITNDYMISGYLLVLGGFCVLLAVIGIANVFSNTLGFLTQRKREFAQYMSVGMTPAGIRKMFCVEALVIAGRPLLITLPLTVIFVQLMAAASHLNPVEFWAEAPIIPIAVFCLAIFVFVALAYYIGGKRLLRCNLIEALRNDTIA